MFVTQMEHWVIRRRQFIFSHLLSILVFAPRTLRKPSTSHLRPEKSSRKSPSSFFSTCSLCIQRFISLSLSRALLIVSSATMTTIFSTEKTRTRHNEVLLSLSFPASSLASLVLCWENWSSFLVLSLSTWNVYVRTLVSFFSFEALVFSRLCRGIIFIERTREKEKKDGLFHCIVRLAHRAEEEVEREEKKKRRKEKSNKKNMEMVERVPLFLISRPESKAACVCQQYFIFFCS